MKATDNEVADCLAWFERFKQADGADVAVLSQLAAEVEARTKRPTDAMAEAVNKMMRAGILPKAV